jgi:hypothetical protein
MTQELRGLQCIKIHVAYINRQINPDKDKDFTMISAAFNSIAGFDAPINYKVVLGHKD